MRLGYCQNFAPADDLDETLRALREITVPLRARVRALGESRVQPHAASSGPSYDDSLVQQAGDSRAPSRGDVRTRAHGDSPMRLHGDLGQPLHGASPSQSLFGVGLYLSNAVARTLPAPSGERDLERLAQLCSDHELDPFTFNAFPYSGFHGAALKERVFAPTWAERERLEFTVAVARTAVALAQRLRTSGDGAHVSISTHCGGFGDAVSGEAERAACARHFALAIDAFARLEDAHGTRIVLALEPEPRSSANDCGDLAAQMRVLAPLVAQALAIEGRRGLPSAHALVARHFGACLDTCHEAVEFEERTLDVLAGITLGKVQASSAIHVTHPGLDRARREALFALHEPRYLHQVTGRRAGGLVRAKDLPEVAAACADANSPWLACDAWRVHFHVPVDRVDLGGGLETTRGELDRLLGALLADPTRWTTPELHVEIETYTWSVLPGAARGPAELVDGLAREYAHVAGVLAAGGFERERDPSPGR